MKEILVLEAEYVSLSFIKNLPKNIFKQATSTLIPQNPYHYVSVLLHEVVSRVKNKEILF